jgi:oxygen-independent coproporphyrinogen III oxidase
MHPTISIDPELIRRYDRRGPRYTSYPTAAQFVTQFTHCDYRRAALLSNGDLSRNLSAYLHIPFCQSPCFYCGCNKIITRRTSDALEYLVRVKREIELQGGLFDRRRRMQQLHFGGGTPTYFSIAQLAEIIEQLEAHFNLEQSAQREFSIEIDPRTVSRETMPGLAALGFNRVSLGVQDFDPAVQLAVNRVQSVTQVRDCSEQARASGFKSVSFDLIYGLPKQTPTSFSHTLDAVIRLRPDRIAAYGYAHMPQLFKAQRAILTASLPDAETRLQLLQLTTNRLIDAGYVYIGMDHFALPTDTLVQDQEQGHLQRNFQGYSTRAECDLIGLGISAIGKVGHCYAQNTKRLTDYYRALDENRLPIERGIALTVDDRARAQVIQRLMCDGQVSYRDIEEEFALDFKDYFAGELSELKAMETDGLLATTHEHIQVRDAGRALVRNIAMVFDAYLPGIENRYSKAI